MSIRIKVEKYSIKYLFLANSILGENLGNWTKKYYFAQSNIVFIFLKK